MKSKGMTLKKWKGFNAVVYFPVVLLKNSPLLHWAGTLLSGLSCLSTDIFTAVAFAFTDLYVLCCGFYLCSTNGIKIRMDALNTIVQPAQTTA